MKIKTLIIIIIVVIIGCCIIVKNTKKEDNTNNLEESYSSINLNNINIDTSNVEEKRKKLDEILEKGDIQFATLKSMIGETEIEDLTYDKLDEKLKEKFGEGNYSLKGPDESGSFFVEINSKVYTINSDGTVRE